LAFSPDGRVLAAADRDSDLGSVQLWDVSSRALLKSFGKVKRLTFAPGGHELALVTQDGVMRLTDPGRHELRSPVEQLTYPVSSLAFSPDGRVLATGSRRTHTEPIRNHLGAIKMDRTPASPVQEYLRLWDVASRLPLPPRLSQPTGVAHLTSAFSPDRRTLASGAADGAVWLWDYPSGRARHTFLVGKQAAELVAKWKAVVGMNLPSGNALLTGQVRALAFSPNGNLLAAGSADGVIKLLDPVRGTELATVAHDAPPVHALAFSADGALLAYAWGTIVNVWDTAGGRWLRTLTGHSQPVTALAFAPHGTLLATAGEDWNIKLWDAATGQERTTFVGHAQNVSALAFTPDGLTLASGSWDKTVRLWHVATGAQLMVLEGHSGKVHAVAFTPDGKTLASGGETAQGTGEVYLWHAGKEFRP
jgi:WD40 repeat protein